MPRRRHEADLSGTGWHPTNAAFTLSRRRSGKTYRRWSSRRISGYAGSWASCSSRSSRLVWYYADTAALAKHPKASMAIDEHDLRDRVVEWKSRFFGSSWAHYDRAKPGTFHLVPPTGQQPALHRDYQAMRDMSLRRLGIERKKPRLGHLGFLLNPWVASDFATDCQVAGTGFEPVTSRL